MPPVVDHAVHEMTRFDDSKRYGCHNRKDFADLYRAPQRFQTSDGYQAVFKYEAVTIPFTMSRTCRYDRSLQDPWCGDCKHRGSGEAYDAKVRELANVK